MIDLDMMPPDWKFAQNHAKANKPGLTEDLLNPNSSNVFCPCCLKPIIKNDVSLLNNSKQLEFLGFGFPLYFIFIKYCIILLIILICSYSTVSLYWGIANNQQFCHRRLLSDSGTVAHCTSVFVKWARIQQYISDQELIMRTTSFIIQLLALVYIRDNIMKTMQYYDQRTTSLSDYSLIIKNLPLKGGIKQSIQDFIHIHFQQKWNELKNAHFGPEFQQQTKVMQITLLPQIQDYYKLTHQKAKIIEEKKSLLKQQDNVDRKLLNNSSQQNAALEEANLVRSKIKNQNQKINLINQNISQISTRYRSLAKQDKLKSQIAIVTLNSQIFKSEVIQYEENNKLNSKLLMKYFGQFQGQIQIQQAPEPNQIKWHNVNSSNKKVFLSKITGWILSCIFIALVTIGFYFLLLLKTKYLLAAIQQKNEQTITTNQTTMHYKMAVFLVFFDIILIVLFNKLVMGAVLHYFTHLQLHFTTSDEEFSFAMKYTLGLFFTTALMTLAVEAVTFQNFYSYQYGVVEQESIMFIINAFLIPLIWFVNPWQIVTLIARKYKFNRKYYTQRQANETMSDTPYTIGKRYAQIIQTMWFTYLYATLIPVGAFFTVLGLSFYYWVDKCNLIKRSSLAHNISGDMAIVSLKLLDVTLVLKLIGQIIFDTQVRHTYSIESIVLVGLGALYIVLPIDKFLKIIHKEEFQPQQKSFNEVKDMFLQTYQTLHPILSFKTLKVFDNLKKKYIRQISLNEIQITQIQLDTKRQRSNSLKMDFYNSNNLMGNNSNNLIDENSNNLIGHKNSNKYILYSLENNYVIKNEGDAEAELQFINYESRRKKLNRQIQNTASRSLKEIKQCFKELFFLEQKKEQQSIFK